MLGCRWFESGCRDSVCSVYSSQYKNRTFSNLKHKFDLPSAADFYFPFEYKEKMSYIHGNGLNKHILQTFRNVHGHKRQKKHTFSKKEEIDSNTSLLYVKQGLGKENLGFNNSILQIGPYLMIFGGGHNQYGNHDTYFTIEYHCLIASYVHYQIKQDHVSHQKAAVYYTHCQWSVILVSVVQQNTFTFGQSKKKNFCQEPTLSCLLSLDFTVVAQSQWIGKEPC